MLQPLVGFQRYSLDRFQGSFRVVPISSLYDREYEEFSPSIILLHRIVSFISRLGLIPPT